MLTDTTIRNAKPGEKTRALLDARGLYLYVTPHGGKWWRCRYRYGGKEKMLSLGTYPDISLKEARARRDELRRQLAHDIDPAAVRKAAKATLAGADSFEALACEWYARFSPPWSESYREKVTTHLEKDLIPWLGQRPTMAITPPELLAVIRRVESRGALETAHRALQTAGRIFRYGVATGRAERDPSGDLRGALPPIRNVHFPTLTDPAEIGHLLRAIEAYPGTFVVKSALRLAPLVFVRPGELRKMEWSEVDLDRGEWRLPAAKMKMRQEHLVPLSRQAVAILKEIEALTGAGRFVFPNLREPSEPLSEVALLAALRRLGYAKEQLNVHGFRAMASTMLNEQGWHPDVIERQLAHAESNAIRAAYNRAEHLPERRRMMQSWADYLDGLKLAGKVVSIRRKTG